MNKSWFYLGAISTLAVLMTSCGDSDNNKSAAPSSPSPSAAVSPAPAATAVAPTSTASPSAPLATAPLVPGKDPVIKNVSVDVAAGLIPATEGDSWARTVAKGRPDPFAVLTLQPIEVSLPKDPIRQPAQTPTASNDQTSNSSPTAKIPRQSSKIAKTSPAVKSGVNQPLPEIKVPNAIAAKPDVTRDPDQIQPIKPAKQPAIIAHPKPALPPNVNKEIPKKKVTIGSKLISNILTPKPTVAIKPATQAPTSKPTVAIKPAPPTVVIKPLPEPVKSTPIVTPAKPEPILARTVGVSGIMQVDGKTQVIVKLPNESFSRYVEVGDRIYDDKIRVKRVEGEQSLSPVVVLEEVGVEVSRRVGDTPGAATKDGN